MEVAGVVLGAIPIIISALNYQQQYYQSVTHVTKWRRMVREYGWITTIPLHTLFRDAISVMDKVEQFVIRAEDQKFMAFITSYSASFNMIGVAVRLFVPRRCLTLELIE